MGEKLKTGILSIEDPYYIEKNIVPMNDRGIFRAMPLTDGDAPFLKPVVKKERFANYISFLFDYQDISGRIVYTPKDYGHLFSAFTVSFFPREDDYDEEHLQDVCRLLSQKLQANIQLKVSTKILHSFVKGVQLKSKTLKKQDFTFHKLFEHTAFAAEAPLQKYMEQRFDFWFACGENEAAEQRAVFGAGETMFGDNSEN